MFSRRGFLQMSLLPLVYGLRGRAQSDWRGIVIGVGMSGVTVAQALQQAGVSITVLEARDRLGGRIWSDRSLGSPVDMGASWIHGVDGNPLVELTDNIETVMTSFDSLRIFGDNGAPITDSSLEALNGELEAFLVGAYELAETLEADMSMGNALRTLLEGEPLTTLQHWGVVTSIEHDYASSLDDLSLYTVVSGGGFDGGDVMFPHGYQQVVDVLANDLDIRHNQVVRRLEYSADGVRVITDNDVFEADGAVVTLPLGVLKQGGVEFSPALPAWKQDAINRLAMGRLNKVALRFPEVFWQRDVDFLGYVSDTRGEFPIFVNLDRATGQPILLNLISGDFAEQLENRADAEIQEGVMSVLRRIYGASIPEPDGMVVSRWGQDPYAFGSYSHIPVGATPRDYEALAEPVGERLFFAGEATTAEYAGTVHGAYLSGLREAERILNA